MDLNKICFGHGNRFIPFAKKLKNLRSDKSPGPDGVHPHLLKTFADTFASILYMIYTITESEELQSLWKTGIITALYKKGKNLKPKTTDL